MSQENILSQLDDVIQSRKDQDPDSSYVAGLLQGKEDRVLKKIAEEAVELVIAVKDGNQSEIIHEAADLWFHSLVPM